MNGEENETSPMTALDQLVTGDSVQMIKAAIPYLSPQLAGFAAIYCKFVELEKTMQLIGRMSGGISAMSAGDSRPDMGTLLNDIKKYASPQGRRQIDSLQQMLETVQLFSMMQEMGNINTEAEHECELGK